LQDAQNLRFFIVPHFDIWMRDFGPIFLSNKINKQQKIVSFDWNVWGYLWNVVSAEDSMKDQPVALHVAKHLGYSVVKMEGLVSGNKRYL
jgi:agmatine deiminase